jgi:DDE superfamily endonuclease
MRIRAAQRNPELRADWMRKLASYTADQLIFVDESATNERTGHRKCGWAPVGITPHEDRVFQRSKRWSVLPAYTVDGFMIWDIEHGSFTQELFEDFIEFRLLPLCNPFPGVRSIIIMDNAPIHHSDVCNCVFEYV